jgi:hypothetical protein
MTALTPLECEVAKMLLAGEDGALAVLRDQLKHAQVRSREMTGVGFYAEFALPFDAVRIKSQPNFKLGDVTGKATNVQHGLGFLLYVTDGGIAMLEGYTYDEPWPDEVQGLVLSYLEGKDRNLDIVRRIMSKG